MSVRCVTIPLHICVADSGGKMLEFEGDDWRERWKVMALLVFCHRGNFDNP